jgi:hypothetical protein
MLSLFPSQSDDNLLQPPTIDYYPTNYKYQQNVRCGFILLRVATSERYLLDKTKDNGIAYNVENLFSFWATVSFSKLIFT